LTDCQREARGVSDLLRDSRHEFTHEARRLAGFCFLENETMEETRVERRKLVT